jgi:hypothetical protein
VEGAIGKTKRYWKERWFVSESTVVMSGSRVCGKNDDATEFRNDGGRSGRLKMQIQ